MENPVVHFEIAGPDGPALQQFYRDLFNWNVETLGEDMRFYGLVEANEGGVGGGIFQTDGNTPPDYADVMPSSHVTVYVQVDNLEDTLNKITDMGGSVAIPPREIAPGMGSVAMFNDPAQNFMGLYSLPTGWEGEMPPKGSGPPVVHFEVGGEDSQSLENFYTRMFGWKINFIEEVNYRLIERETDGIGGGMFEHAEGMPANAPSIAVQVNDIQAYLDKAVSLGGVAIMQPTDIPGGFGSLAIFNDIAGNRIALFGSLND